MTRKRFRRARRPQTREGRIGKVSSYSYRAAGTRVECGRSYSARSGGVVAFTNPATGANEKKTRVRATRCAVGTVRG